MVRADKLYFGTAGVPLGAPSRSSVDGVRHIKKIGLEAMELEFVHGVRMGPDVAAKVKKAAQESGVMLTAHGPYYINLNSLEPEKVEASIKRILDTARAASLCGGYSITFHAAFYLGQDKRMVFETVKSRLAKITAMLKSEEIDIFVRPETTGKATQFGDVDEIIALSEQIEMVLPCVDFSHLHARSNGKFNTYEEFCEVLSKLERKLGRRALDNMHIHISGIEYSEKGERNHVVLKKSDMNYKDLLRALRDFKCKGVVVCESPNLEEDALMMKREYGR